MSTAPSAPPLVPSGPGLHAAVSRLQADAAAVQALLAAGSLEQLSEAAMAQAAVTLAAAGEATASATSTVLARVAGCGYPAAEGHVTPASWWQARTRISRDAASDQVRLARRLSEHYPATSAAWAGGDITAEHTRVLTIGIDAVLARFARGYRREHSDAGIAVDRDELAAFLTETRTRLEDELLVLARRWGPETLRMALARIRDLADPDGSSDAAMKAATRATLTIEEVGDLAVITAQVSREVAAMVRTVLDHYRDTRYHRGTTIGSDTTGGEAGTGPDGTGHESNASGARSSDTDPVTGRPVTVTNAQRDAAALTDWVTATLDCGLGSERQGERPHLDLIVTLEDLAAGIGDTILERTGRPAPIGTARRHACDADIRLVLVDGQYRHPQTGDLVEPALAGLLIAGTGVLDYGRAHRIVPTRLRRALGIRDRGCAFPGCHRPPQHTQAHHVRHWAEGGDTSLSNTVLLCSRHHHYVHEGGWTITLRAGASYTQPGCWAFTRPHRPRP